VLVGDAAQKDLPTIWAEWLAAGHVNWGGSSDAWTQAYLDDTLRVSLLYNFAVEGIALAAVTALVDGDAAIARSAVRANTVLLASYGVALMGMLDMDGGLPEVLVA
jgi:hypothetical protein